MKIFTSGFKGGLLCLVLASLFISSFLSCNEAPKKEKVVEKEASANDKAFAKEIIARNSGSGFAEADKAKKRSIINIAQSFLDGNLAATYKLGSFYAEKYGADSELNQIFNAAQMRIPNTFVWKGGTPGREDEWNEAKNWDSNKIPNEDSNVLIKSLNSGHNAQPVINKEIQVTSIEIHSNAKLIIEKEGKLIVDGENTYSEGISIFGGTLQADGEIIVKNIDKVHIAKCEPISSDKDNEFYSKKYDYKFTVLP